MVTLEHGSLSLNSLANSLCNLGTRKKTYNFNEFSKNDLIVETLINEDCHLNSLQEFILTRAFQFRVFIVVFIVKGFQVTKKTGVLSLCII